MKAKKIDSCRPSKVCMENTLFRTFWDVCMADPYKRPRLDYTGV
jgi:hypothetical protein